MCIEASFRKYTGNGIFEIKDIPLETDVEKALFFLSKFVRI